MRVFADPQPSDENLKNREGPAPRRAFFFGRTRQGPPHRPSRAPAGFCKLSRPATLE